MSFYREWMDRATEKPNGEITMNPLRGFMMRSGKNEMSRMSLDHERRYQPDADLSGEPTLEEMLSDPVVMSMMRRDGVSRMDIIQVFDRWERKAA
jgi:hypothetical protein